MPQQNRVAERKNRHILEVAVAMLNKKHIPKSYWAEAANTALYLINRCTMFDVHEVTLHEKFFKKKSDLSHVWKVSSIAYVAVPFSARSFA